MDANGFGGFSISGQTRESISEQIEAYIHHARGLKTLIDSEILPEPILGGVYTKLLEGGDLEVKWIRQSDMRTENTSITKIYLTSSEYTEPAFSGCSEDVSAIFPYVSIPFSLL